MVVEISDWNDLDNVRNDLTADYVLVNDLDSETDGYVGVGDDFTPIGVGLNDNFNGTFDGDGFAINDLVVEIDSSDVGLFGCVSRDTSQTTIIENLSVSGSVTNTGAEIRTGGLVGLLDDDGSGEIKNCVSHVDVTSNGNQAGGLVGRNDDTVTDSYATGSVEGDRRVGGLVGYNRDTTQRSYAVGLVTGNTDVGGLVGDNLDTVTDSYWDTETTGQSTSDGGTGLTTAEMQGSEAETNMNFDFADVWDSVLESDGDTTADGYPILIALDRENQLIAQGIKIAEITGQITLDATGVGTANVLLYNLTKDLFQAKTATESDGTYSATLADSGEGSGDTIAIAIDFDDGTDRYGRLVTTVLE